MTKLPLIDAGAFSAARSGTVEAFAPIPIPNKSRQTNSCCQFLVMADPIADIKQNIAAKKIVPRRPRRAFKGSESQQPLVRISERLWKQGYELGRGYNIDAEK